LICQLPDAMPDTIILQAVMHLPRSFNHILQAQITENYVIVKLVNQYSFNLSHLPHKLIVAAPQ
jgi:hypothetical protein